MKAYIVSLVDDPDVGNEIVFANNIKEAKKKALSCEVVESKECFTDIRVRRYDLFDSMENLSHRQLAKEQWREGWNWFDENSIPNCDIANDAEFYNWYDARLYR